MNIVILLDSIPDFSNLRNKSGEGYSECRTAETFEAPVTICRSRSFAQCWSFAIVPATSAMDDTLVDSSNTLCPAHVQCSSERGIPSASASHSVEATGGRAIISFHRMSVPADPRKLICELSRRCLSSFPSRGADFFTCVLRE